MGTIDTIEQDSKTLIRNFLYAELNRSIRDEIISKIYPRHVTDIRLEKEKHVPNCKYLSSSALKHQFEGSFKVIEKKNPKKISLMFII